VAVIAVDLGGFVLGLAGIRGARVCKHADANMVSLHKIRPNLDSGPIKLPSPAYECRSTYNVALSYKNEAGASRLAAFRQKSRAPIPMGNDPISPPHS
jgi:hypothetical protein